METDHVITLFIKGVWKCWVQGLFGIRRYISRINNVGPFYVDINALFT